MGDFIFTSSIYPIHLDGRAIMGDTWLGLAGDSVITVQTRHCLMTLKERLTELGSSLQRVVKVDVHLASAADFLLIQDSLAAVLSNRSTGADDRGGWRRLSVSGRKDQS